MQISELQTLASWYVENVQKAQIEQITSRTIANLKASSSTANRENLKQEKSNLMDAVAAVNCSELTKNQRKCLLHLNVGSIILPGAAAELKHLFDLSKNDKNYVLTTLERYLQSLKSANQAFAQVRAGMPVIVPKEHLSSPTVPEGKVLTRLTFQHDASINNFVELNDWGKRWNLIARGFSMAVNEPIEDFEIVNADRGSLVVDILVGASAMTIIFESLKALTELAVAVTELRIKHRELDAFKNTVPQEVFDQFVEASNASIEKKEDEIVESVIAKLTEQNLIKNDAAHNDVSRAIKEIHRFNSHGGSFESVASNDENFNSDVIRELNDSYKLLQTEAEIKLLQDKKNDG